MERPVGADWSATTWSSCAARGTTPTTRGLPRRGCGLRPWRAARQHAALVLGNLHKGYLADLGELAVPTVVVPAGMTVELGRLRWHGVGGQARRGRRRQRRRCATPPRPTSTRSRWPTTGRSTPSSSRTSRDVERRGEVSVVCIGGEPTHAVRKLPAAGEFRVHAHRGGTAEPVAPGAAAGSTSPGRCSGALRDRSPPTPASTCFRRRHGDLVVTSSSSSSPYLYLELAPAAADRFAGAAAPCPAPMATVPRRPARRARPVSTRGAAGPAGTLRAMAPRPTPGCSCCTGSGSRAWPMPPPSPRPSSCRRPRSCRQLARRSPTRASPSSAPRRPPRGLGAHARRARRRGRRWWPPRSTPSGPVAAVEPPPTAGSAALNPRRSTPAAAGRSATSTAARCSTTTPTPATTGRWSATSRPLAQHGPARVCDDLSATPWHGFRPYGTPPRHAVEQGRGRRRRLVHQAVAAQLPHGVVRAARGPAGHARPRPQRRGRRPRQTGDHLMGNARFGNVVTAMVTPVHATAALDLDGAAALARWLVAHGNDGLVVAGTTGEAPTLSDDEKVELWRAVRDAVDVPLLAGTGSNDTRHTIGLSGGPPRPASTACWSSRRTTTGRPRPASRPTSGRWPTPPTCRSCMYDVPIRTGPGHDRRHDRPPGHRGARRSSA